MMPAKHVPRYRVKPVSVGVRFMNGIWRGSKAAERR